MNIGIFGEGFPYSNFHDLNMDWIIKIAKDFLDQYTHIQEIISSGEQSIQDLTTSGLEQLQEKADNLEELLQQWYDTHSTDIANQLAEALADLNMWYQAHEDILYQFINQRVTEEVTSQYDSENVIFDNIPIKTNGVPHTVSSSGIYNALHKRRMIVCGDSYLMDYDFNWGLYLKLMLGIADEDFYKGGLSGGGFLSAPGTTGIANGFLIGLNAIAETVVNPETITDIVLCGGLNDSSYGPSAFPQSDFDANVNAFINYCKEHYPIARIWIGYCGNAIDFMSAGYLGTRTIDNRLYTIDRYSKIFPRVSVSVNTELWKVFTLDFNMFNTTDWLHPNTLGSLMIALAIREWITGSPTIIKQANGSIVRSIGTDLSSSLTQQPYDSYNDNGYLRVKIHDWYEQNGYRADYLGTLNTNYTPGSNIEVSLITGGNFLFIKPFTINVPMCYGNIGTHTYCNALLTFTDNKILLKPLTTEAIPAGTNIFIASNQTIIIPPEYYV